KHPIVVVTGSSGAGTSSVTRTFQHIFRREEINAAIVEGDSFHRYDREQMKAATADADKEGNHHFCHFSPEANLLEELETLFREYGENGRGKVRKYLHDPQEAKPHGQQPGTFTPWDDVAPDSDLLFYEGLHGAAVTAKADVAKHADLLVGVVPIINLEWIQKLHRDKTARGYTSEDVVDTVLRRMPDYVNYIPERRRELRRHPVRQAEGHRLSLPAVDAARLVHVTAEHHRRAGREDGAGHAADLHSAHPEADGGTTPRLSARPAEQRLGWLDPIFSANRQVDDAFPHLYRDAYPEIT
ncbi:MAG: hypothetical protein ABR922_19865, partial [Streptosporangiaceae bacterium]